ncbi:hypothetical protein TrLO_g463 [Triparma laevis f. longispina]|uniref:Uncharacterized protein n=1 Tax=Triparma laevis f. longispina TaxID=1714387 RepID=A0A9W7FL92_9STRA|nr:hypothetical protein TrLO_g463 [Triparma laevis f. longispina]
MNNENICAKNNMSGGHMDGEDSAHPEKRLKTETTPLQSNAPTLPVVSNVKEEQGGQIAGVEGDALVDVKVEIKSGDAARAAGVEVGAISQGYVNVKLEEEKVEEEMLPSIDVEEVYDEAYFSKDHKTHPQTFEEALGVTAKALNSEGSKAGTLCIVNQHGNGTVITWEMNSSSKYRCR